MTAASQIAFQPRRASRTSVSLRLCGLAAAAVAWAAAVHADPAACKALADDRQRLACYDALTAPAPPAAVAAPAAAPASIPAASPPAPVAAPPAAQAPDSVQPAAAAPAAAVPSAALSAVPPPVQAVAPAAAAVPAATPTPQTFGSELLFKPGDQPVVDLSAHAAGSFDGFRRGTSFNLDNGQVWVCLDDYEYYYEADNPVVVIHRNVVGNYWLTPEHAEFSVRVSRVK